MFIDNIHLSQHRDTIVKMMDRPLVCCLIPSVWERAVQQVVIIVNNCDLNSVQTNSHMASACHISVYVT